MHRLIGAIFLTATNGDVGFPIFQLPRENRLYTCLLDRKLVILRFVPCYPERYSLSYLETPGSTYKVGDKFPLLIFRNTHRTELLDLDDEDSIRGILQGESGLPFQKLQVTRYKVEENHELRHLAISTISRAAKSFALDRASEMSFISTETSMLSATDRLWRTSNDGAPEPLLIQEIYNQFEGIEKIEAARKLGTRSSMAENWWPYLYLLYDQKFGADEFLRILGVQYLGWLIASGRSPTRVVGEVVYRTIEAQQHVWTVEENIFPLDRSLIEALEDLISSKLFMELCELYPPLLMSAMLLVYWGTDDIGMAVIFGQLLLEYRNNLSGDFGANCVDCVEHFVRQLDLGELQSFSRWFLGELGRRDRLSGIMDNKRRLLSLVVTELHKSTVRN